MLIRFTINGDPKTLQRHRTYTKDRNGKPLRFARNVDPSEQDKFTFLAKSMANRPDKPLDEATRVSLQMFFKRPKSHYRTGKFAGQLKPSAPEWYTSVPDADNIAKFVLDALNRFFWKDDCRICDLRVQKKYSDHPRTELVITNNIDAKDLSIEMSAPRLLDCVQDAIDIIEQYPLLPTSKYLSERLKGMKAIILLEEGE